MKLSLNWLNYFVDVKDLSTQELIDRIVKAGFEVESVDKIGEGTNLVVGEVLTCEDHPDSDHLHVTTVNVGNEVLDIVCGAPNCRKGLKVIVAKVGAKLPGGEIKASKIRGVASNGMLCSLLELGVPKELLKETSCSHNGIEELDDSYKIGDTDILKKLGYDDTVLDISIYANRPDCLSVYYMCKEIAAILRRPCNPQKFDGASKIGDKTDLVIKSETPNCPHFLGKIVNHVEIKESPLWMQECLRANGIKCINNLVDISNFVMLETGQPMHFYDLRSNPKKEITVKDNLDEKYMALDEIEYDIKNGDIMITSDNKAIGIGGIMGGEGTKVLDDTTSLILESALFDHAQIRRTSNRLGLQTEAAARFSKGLEPLAQIKAMDEACDLLIKYANASGFEETVEFGSDNYSPIKVEETLSHLNKLIGKEYEMNEVLEVLNALDFKPEVNGETFISNIPSYRTDIKIKEDIDEEICRLTNFDDLHSTLPLMPQTVGKLTKLQSIRRTIRDYLAYNGLNETMTYTLVEKSYIDNECLHVGNALEVLAPISEQRRYIRTSLMNSLIEALIYNLDHFNNNVNIFEMSECYFEGGKQERLGILLNGNLFASKVKHLVLENDFYVLKGLVTTILDKLGYEKGRVQISENTLDVEHFHPGISCVLKMNNKEIGILGKLHPTFLNKQKLKDVYYAEIILDELVEANPSKTKSPLINKYPSITRDISIVVKDEVSANELIKVISKAGGKLVKNVEIFDVYKGEHIEEGYKSVSLNIIFESLDKTLKVEDINEPYQKILDELNKQYSANLRS